MTSSLSSDGTLNPNGVRFGSSEIYNIGTCVPSRPVLLWSSRGAGALVQSPAASRAGPWPV